MITNEELLDTVCFQRGVTVAGAEVRIHAVAQQLGIAPIADGWLDDDADEICLALANGMVCDSASGISLRAATYEEHRRSDNSPGGEFIDADGRKVYVRTID